jgi:hypothetical protein
MGEEAGTKASSTIINNDSELRLNKKQIKSVISLLLKLINYATKHIFCTFVELLLLRIKIIFLQKTKIKNG